MTVGKVRLFCENFLERCDGGFKLLLVDVALRFIQQVVKRIGKFLGFRGDRRFRFRRGL